MMKSQSYRDLIVWQRSIQLCMQIYKICEAFPKSELYGLADQMKRAAVSVSSNIAEGQARQHTKEFLHFLSVAAGSLAELDTQRILAENLYFIDAEKALHWRNGLPKFARCFTLFGLNLRLALKTEN